MKNSDKNKRNELTKKILFTIAGVAAIGAVITVAAMAPNCVQLIKLFEKDKNKKKKTARALYRLKKQRLIEVHEESGAEVVKITENGRQRILKYKFEEMEIIKSKKWDKIWRIIIFDIPEKHKKARDALRLKIQELGFYQLQKSVFVFPYECKNEIDFVTELFKIKKFVSYIEAKTIENDEKLKYNFNLN